MHILTKDIYRKQVGYNLTASSAAPSGGETDHKQILPHSLHIPFFSFVLLSTTVRTRPSGRTTIPTAADESRKSVGDIESTSLVATV